MRDQKGNAVTIVLLILAVVSLLGVGAMTQSRISMQFTSSLTHYDRMLVIGDYAG